MTTHLDRWSTRAGRLADHDRTCGFDPGRHRPGCPYLALVDAVITDWTRRNRLDFSRTIIPRSRRARRQPTVTTTPEQPKSVNPVPASDLERLASAINSLGDLRNDMRAAAGISDNDPVLGPRGVYFRQLVDIEADVRSVYQHLLGEEARRWAAERPGMVELVLPEGDTISGP